jgi:hypothetical protein
MKSQTKFLVAVTVLFMVVPPRVHGQSVDLLLSRLASSKTDTARARAFSELVEFGNNARRPTCSPQAAAQVRRALIDALEKENNLVHNPSAELSETDTEYYADLIGCVAMLRDPNAAPALLGAIETGGGAIDGLVALGDPSVPGLLAILDGPGDRGRVAAIVAAGKLAAPNRSTQPERSSNHLAPEKAAAIRVRLIKALNYKDRFVRIAAVRSLSCYSDPEVERAIRLLASNDPAAIEIGGGKKDYPVRRAAEDWLKQNSSKSQKPSP